MTRVSWADVADALSHEMLRARGRFALVVGQDARGLTQQWAALTGETAVSVGRYFSEQPERLSDPEGALIEAGFLLDLDILLWPALRLDPLQLLRTLARRKPRVAVWPGGVAAGRAVYSAPSRLDHYDRPLADVLVLHTNLINFPDETPFNIQRIPA